jgi:hypothetical protein
MVKEALPGWSGWIPASWICRARSTRSRIRTVKICRARITNRSSRKKPKPKPFRAAAASEAVGKDLCAAAVLREGESDKVLYAHASRILHHETNPAVPAR